jgi:hypothetical protein
VALTTRRTRRDNICLSAAPSTRTIGRSRRAREVELWSARDSGNFVDLAAAKPSPPAPKEEENDWEFSDNDAESDDYNAFSRR